MKIQNQKPIFSSYQKTTIIKQPLIKTLQILPLPKNYILLLNSNSTITIYTPIFYNLLLTIPNTIHFNQINKVTLLKNGKIITSSSDKTLNLISIDFSIPKYNILQCLIGHSLDVWMCLELSDENLASSSHDKTIRIWYFNNEEKLYEELLILDTSPDIIGDFIETKDKILICSSLFYISYHIQFWDIEKYEKIGIIDNILSSGIRNLIQINDDIICVNGSGNFEGLQFISISNMEILKQGCFFDLNITSFIILKDGSFLIGEGKSNNNENENFGNLRLFNFNIENLEFEEVCFKEKCHSYPVLDIVQLDNGDIITASREVIIWRK